jgi:IS605 OrfB family transposase
VDKASRKLVKELIKEKKLMVKAIKVMLLPNNVQKTKMFQYAGASRFAYNWALAREKENYEKGGRFISDSELRKEFTRLRHSEEYAWLLNISNNVTKQAIKDACTAYRNFFKGLQKFPRFKSKKRSTPKFYQDNIKIRFSNTHVKLEGFSLGRKANKQKINWVRFAEHGRIPTDTKYMNPRISFDGLNWWISVCVEFPDCKESLNNDGMGIDLGIKDLAVCSDAVRYKNINKSQPVRKLEKQKRRLQHSISRSYEKNKKGKNYCKTHNIVKKEKLLLKLNHRLTNIRKNYLNQTISEIINRKPRFICIEDLNVSGMMKNRRLSKAIQEQGFFRFRRQLEYKCSDKGIQLIVADRFYPSSKLCSRCGKIKKNLKLSDRVYRCDCGNMIDRDFQASINLKAYGEQFAI